MTDFFPPWTIGTAICCGGLILPVFALLRRTPTLQESGRRLCASVILVTVISATVLLAGHMMGLPIRGVDFAAGAAIILSAAICAFLVISLLAWGFTISIARDLGAAGKPVSLEEWKAAFANGSGFDAFARDRLALLVAMGVASANGGKLILTARGRLISRLAIHGMIYFAVDRARR